MYDYSRITERLYVGSQIRSAADVDDLKRAGVTHIIDCCEADDSVDVEGSGVALLWDATADDGQRKGVTWFSPGIDFALGALGHPGYAVLCHCAAGINRGPSMAYAIMRAQGIRSLDAETILRVNRPQVGIAYKADAESALRLMGWTR